MCYSFCNIFKFYFSLPCFPGYSPHKRNPQSWIANHWQGENTENGINIAGDATTAMYVFF